MKTLIIYLSIHHNNTKKIAKAIARVLKADLVKVEKAKPMLLKNYDVVGFGSGIYMWKHHQSLLDFVKKIPKQNNKKAFIFSTRGAKMIKTGHSKLKSLLITKGFSIIDEFSCPGWDTFGPLKFVGGLNKKKPDKKDIIKAQDFALEILKKLE